MADGDPKYACEKSVFCNISKTNARVSSCFQTRETFETTRPQAEWFYCFRAFGNLMKPEERVFEITSPTKKISLNYHLNVDVLRNEILKSTVIVVVFSPKFSLHNHPTFSVVMIIPLIDIISV